MKGAVELGSLVWREASGTGENAGRAEGMTPRATSILGQLPIADTTAVAASARDDSAVNEAASWFPANAISFALQG